MSRNLGPSCKQCRREGHKLFLKGARCLTQKCALSENSNKKLPPGFTQSRRRKKPSDYNIQLREKQKVKRVYGILEKQFRLYYREAERRVGVTGSNLVKILESRLDNIVFRMNFTSSRKQARQLISHGHVYVNGRKVTIASYLLREGDEVSIREKMKKNEVVLESLKQQKSANVHWVEVDMDNAKGKFVSLPDVQDLEIPMNMQLIVELYSK